MKIVDLQTIPVRIPYKHAEVSSLIDRSGIVDIVVKITTDNGLVGWGEAQRAASARKRGGRDSRPVPSMVVAPCAEPPC